MQSTVSQAEGLRQKHSWQYFPLLLQAAAVLSLFAPGLPPAGLDPGQHGSSPPESLETGTFPTKKNSGLRILFLRHKEKAHRNQFVPNKTQK